MVLFGNNLRLLNGKKFQGRDKADSTWVDVCWVDAGDDVAFAKRPKVVRYEFDRAPRPVAVKSDGGGAPTGTAGDENLLMWPGMTLEYHVLGTQTDVAPEMSTTGLDIGSMDATDNDGAEYCPGVSSKHDQRYVVGTDPAFYFEAKFSIADVSGTDDCAVGFRKVEAYQAAIDDYDEMACLNVISGDIKIETILNGGATTTTDTTDNWADAETKTLRVEVSAAGVVTYKIDGSAPTTTAAYTFDDAEVVVPFIYLLNASDLHGAVHLIHWESGYL